MKAEPRSIRREAVACGAAASCLGAAVAVAALVGAPWVAGIGGLLAVGAYIGTRRSRSLAPYLDPPDPDQKPFLHHVGVDVKVQVQALREIATAISDEGVRRGIVQVCVQADLLVSAIAQRPDAAVHAVWDQCTLDSLVQRAFAFGRLERKGQGEAVKPQFLELLAQVEASLRKLLESLQQQDAQEFRVHAKVLTRMLILNSRDEL